MRGLRSHHESFTQMLQALLKHKLKDSFNDPSFRPSEDTLTSSVIGLLQFLPDELFWHFLRLSCGKSSKIPENIGNINGVYFWDRWRNTEGTHNTFYVEPDVWIDAENCSVIIEAKKQDGFGQYKTQWENEIKAFVNELGTDDREIVFIALGGNESMKDCICQVGQKDYVIHTASWFNLLHEVSLYQKSEETGLFRQEKRILNNVVEAFFKHGYVDVEWLTTLKCKSLSTSSSYAIKELYEFDNHVFFDGLYNQDRLLSKDTVLTLKTIFLYGKN